MGASRRSMVRQIWMSLACNSATRCVGGSGPACVGTTFSFWTHRLLQNCPNQFAVESLQLQQQRRN